VSACFAGKTLINCCCMYANECNRELIIPGKILPLFLGRLLREPLE
jgi:hypothetical protein